MNIKFLLQLVGIVIFGGVFHTILIISLFKIIGWFSVYLIELNVYIWIFVWLLCLVASSWWIILKFKLAPEQFRVSLVAWFVGISLPGIALLLFLSLSHERLPSADSSIMQNLMNTRSQGELYYNKNQPSSYKEVCKAEGIQSLIKNIEGYGGVVSCYDTEQNWAIESTLVDNSGYYCVDSDGRSGVFLGNSISQDDTACGDVINKDRDYNLDLSSMREVHGQEKDTVLKMVGVVMANMSGYRDISLDSIEPSFSTSTNTYDFGLMGFKISGGSVYLVDREYEVVSFQDNGRIFVK